MTGEFPIGFVFSVRGQSVLIDEWVVTWICERFDVQVNVEVRPVKMVAMYQMHIIDLADPCMSKPGIMLKRQKILFVVDKKPDPVFGNAQNFRL